MSIKAHHPRAIALDIETAPDPEALALLAQNPPDFRPQDSATICKLMAKHLTRVGDKTAEKYLEAFGGPAGFWQAMDAAASDAPESLGAHIPPAVYDKLTHPEQLLDVVAATAGAEEQWWEGLVKQASFSARDGMVVCVGMFDGETAGTITLDECGGDEAELLRQTWAALASYFGTLPPVLVTFNGVEFDIPFMLLRSIKHGVQVPWNLRGRRHTSAPVTDLYQHMTSWGHDRKSGKGANGLLSFARWLGVYHPTKEGGMDGSQVAQYVEDGRWEEIAEYCLDDVKVTWDMYERIRRSDPSILPEFRRATVRHDTRG